MARAKKNKSGLSIKKQYTLPLGVVIIVLFTMLGSLVVLFTRQTETIGKYELLEKIDNQACRYLDKQKGVHGIFKLYDDAPKNKPKLVYKCTTGELTKAKEIHGKSIDAYQLGASVSYFSTNEEAIKFAEEKLNPLRFWGVDAEGQRNGIPQTSRFTFMVTDEQTPYFDAYTVKANAVLRVSLPCTNADPVVCHAEAEAILDRELKGINVL